MPNKINSITDGTFTLLESEYPNVFYFYRNNEEVVGDVGRIPMDFYENWICTKIINGEISKMEKNNICLETSADGKCMRLTVSEIGKCKAKQKQSNFFKRIFSKLLK